MVKSRRLQWSFAGGELSPEMFGHAEDTGFQIGVAKAKNFIIKPSGAAKRRPGFEYITDAANSSAPSYLIPFVYSPTDTLVIEVALGSFRFFDSTGIVAAYSETPRAWLPTQAGVSTNPPNDGVITLTTNDFALGDRVRILGAVSPFQEGVDYFVVDVTGLTIKVSTAIGGTPVVNLPAGPAASIGTVARRYWAGEVVSFGGFNFYALENHENQATTATEYWFKLTSANLEIPHGYLQRHLSELQYTQSADVLTIVHPMYPAMELRRYGERVWRARNIEFGSEIEPPVVGANSPNSGRVFQAEAYNTTTLGTPAQQALLLQFEAPHEMSDGDGVYLSAIVDGVAAGTWVAAGTQVAVGGYGAGQNLALKDPTTNLYAPGTATSGSTSATIRYFPISTDADNTYVITAVDRNGIESAPSAEIAATDNILYVAGAYNRLSWLPVAGAKRYKIYKEQDGLFGYIGQVDDDTGSYFFDDDNITPDLGITPPIEDPAISIVREEGVSITSNEIRWVGHGTRPGDPVWFVSITGMTEVAPYQVCYVSKTGHTYSGFQITDDIDNVEGTPLTLTNGTATVITGDFPSTVAYFEQRRCFGGSRHIPQGLWMTRTNTESDMRYSLPVRDIDRISVVVSSRQANAIKHIVPMDHLLLLTTSSEYRVTPLNDDALTPKSISVRPQTYIGASEVRPVVANNTVVFCAARGGHVREMGYQAAAQGFTTGDLSLRAAHLFDDYEITQADQMKSPHPIVWFASNSKRLLSLTYVPEESVGAWSWQDTNDEVDHFVSIAIVADGEEDRVWAVMNRNNVYTIERMAVQKVTTRAAGRFMDSWIEGASVTIGSSFACAHIADGREVSVLVDGVVYPNQTVASGAVTVPATGATMVVGLPYTSELQTMPFSAQTEAFAQGMPKNVNEVWVRLFESAPFEAGPDTSNMNPSPPDAIAAGALKTGEVDISLLGSWNADGQIVIRQTNPLPLTVVSITAQVTFGGN